MPSRAYLKEFPQMRWQFDPGKLRLQKRQFQLKAASNQFCLGQRDYTEAFPNRTPYPGQGKLDPALPISFVDRCHYMRHALAHSVPENAPPEVYGHKETQILGTIADKYGTIDDPPMTCKPLRVKWLRE